MYVDCHRNYPYTGCPKKSGMLDFCYFEIRKYSIFKISSDKTLSSEKNDTITGKNYKGTPGDFAPEMQKRALENKKEPLKIAIDCNVKACSMLQI